jgi:hypothetical protein
MNLTICYYYAYGGRAVGGEWEGVNQAIADKKIDVNVVYIKMYSLNI